MRQSSTQPKILYCVFFAACAGIILALAVPLTTIKTLVEFSVLAFTILVIILARKKLPHVVDKLALLSWVVIAVITVFIEVSDQPKCKGRKLRNESESVNESVRSASEIIFMVYTLGLGLSLR